MGEELKLIYSPAILKSHYLCVRQVFVQNLASSLIWLEVGKNSDFSPVTEHFSAISGVDFVPHYTVDW